MMRVCIFARSEKASSATGRERLAAIDGLLNGRVFRRATATGGTGSLGKSYRRGLLKRCRRLPARASRSPTTVLRGFDMFFHLRLNLQSIQFQLADFERGGSGFVKFSHAQACRHSVLMVGAAHNRRLGNRT